MSVNDRSRGSRVLVFLGLFSVLCVSALAGGVAFADTPAADKAQPEEATGIPGLLLVMESEGLPGDIQSSDSGEMKRSTQRVLMAKDRLRLFDQENGLSYLFRLGGEEVKFWEISPDARTYKSPRHHRQIQEGRNRLDRQTVRALKRQYRGAELKRWLDREYLREDFTREVTVTGPLAKETRLGRDCSHYQVHENGRLVVDVWTTSAFDLQLPLFDFYRHVGAFSDEVLDKLKGIPGVPLEATLVVVTDSFNFKITAVVSEASPMEFAPDQFELPKGAQELPPEGPTVECANHDCQHMVERAQPEARYDYNGRKFLFCSKACLKEWKEWLKEQLMKRSGAFDEANAPEGDGSKNK